MLCLIWLHVMLCSLKKRCMFLFLILLLSKSSSYARLASFVFCTAINFLLHICNLP